MVEINAGSQPVSVDIDAAPVEPVVPAADAEVMVEDELLVEDISIDGMCGVY